MIELAPATEREIWRHALRDALARADTPPETLERVMRVADALSRHPGSISAKELASKADVDTLQLAHALGLMTGVGLLRAGPIDLEEGRLVYRLEVL